MCVQQREKLQIATCKLLVENCRHVTFRLDTVEGKMIEIVMVISPPPIFADAAFQSHEESLMSEIHSSLRSSKRSASKRSSKLGRTMSLQKPPGDSLASSDLSDSEQLPNDLRRKSTVAYLQRAFATCKMANANKMPHVPDHFQGEEPRFHLIGTPSFF